MQGQSLCIFQGSPTYSETQIQGVQNWIGIRLVLSIPWKVVGDWLTWAGVSFSSWSTPMSSAGQLENKWHAAISQHWINHATVYICYCGAWKKIESFYQYVTNFYKSGTIAISPPNTIKWTSVHMSVGMISTKARPVEYVVYSHASQPKNKSHTLKNRC